MDKLRAMQYLLKVADTLSFSRAAKAFGVPASSISRRITDLEAELGVELLHRTTRTVRLTEIGALYLEQVRAGMAQLNDAEELVGQRSSTPSGTLRISTMPSYGQLLLMPALQDFCERYPDIVLDVHLSDALVDLGRDQIDIAIRGGRQPQDRVVARKLDPNRFVLAASPQYLAQMGTPRMLDDLQGHRALMYRGPNTVIKWQGLDVDGWREIPITPAFISNDGASLIAMARKHRGLVLLSEWGLKGYLRRGELVQVMLDQPASVSRGGEAGIYLLYLQTRYRIPKGADVTSRATRATAPFRSPAGASLSVRYTATTIGARRGQKIPTSFVVPRSPVPVLLPMRQPAGRSARSRWLLVSVASSQRASCARLRGDSASPIKVAWSSGGMARGVVVSRGSPGKASLSCFSHRSRRVTSSPRLRA
jgi:DNA-binding transcriptional LysR family regulator